MINLDKKMKVKIAILLEIFFCVAVILLDLLSKAAIMPFLIENGRHFTLWDGVIELQYALNTGASFGAFEGQTVLLLVVTIITVLAIFAALIYLHNDTNKLLRYGLLLLLGGALGNLYDRIFLGHVRDFIEYTFFETWFGYGFAIGNIADIFCMVATLMILVYVFFLYGDDKLKSRFKRFNK